ncbi:MAG TPA: NAD(P)/FAD-dependent oxidoreductase [Candidatus Solibacter sp.]|nr:NAD(P)/FAD-dependent oxidoreductase [Candidatus Solibacter sp.]
MGIASPCFEEFGLTRYGLEWVHPPAPLAHPLDDGSAIILENSIDCTAAQLGSDRDTWRRVMSPLAEAWPRLRHDITAPPGPAALSVPMLRFAFDALFTRLRDPRARALFAGLCAHTAHSLDLLASRGIGLALAICAHSTGWPFPRGGAQKISDALAACLREAGGRIVTSSPITMLPDAPLVLCDITPRQMLAIAGDRFPGRFRRLLSAYRYGPGAFKVDWALDAPIPWRAPECARAGTVHLGGTYEEIAQWESAYIGHPFVLLTQLSLFDPSRAPAGKHTAWAYCHVPNGSGMDMTKAIEAQVERFAPGFRERILARHVMPPAALERGNANLVGGDFNGGALDGLQMFLRPTRRFYRTPLDGVYFCSSSTPPGGGVHGMCGYNAAKLALR